MYEGLFTEFLADAENHFRQATVIPAAEQRSRVTAELRLLRPPRSGRWAGARWLGERLVAVGERFAGERGALGCGERAGVGPA